MFKSLQSSLPQQHFELPSSTSNFHEAKRYSRRKSLLETFHTRRKNFPLCSAKSSANIRCPMEAISLCNVVKSCTIQIFWTFSGVPGCFNENYSKEREKNCTTQFPSSTWVNQNMANEKCICCKVFQISETGTLESWNHAWMIWTEVATWSSSRDDDPVDTWYFTSITTFSQSGIKRRCLRQWIQRFFS